MNAKTSVSLANFLARLESVAPTDPARAQKYGVTVRLIPLWRKGHRTPSVTSLLRDPESLEALAADARAMKEAERAA